MVPYVKIGLFGKSTMHNDIFTKFTWHPMDWTNMTFSKGQVYAVDFISKTEGPVYFEQVDKWTIRVKN